MLLRPPLLPMKIHETVYIDVSPAKALDAAERWFRKEAPDLSIEEGVTPGGIPYIGTDQLIDGIAITTRFLAEQAGDGTNLTFTLRMKGQSFLGKIRNLGMLPATKYVRQASQNQFSQIVDELQGE